MKITGLAATIALAAVPAAAGGVQEISSKSADFLAGHELTGEKQSCLMLRQVDRIEALDEKLLLVTMQNGDAYLNQPKPACSAGKNTRFEYRTTGSSLCSGEALTVVENYTGTFRGSCSLGPFEVLRKKSPVEGA